MSRAFRVRPYTHWLALPGYSLNGRDPTHTDSHYLGILWTGVMSRAFRARPYTHWLALPGYSLNGRDERVPTHTDWHYLGILWTGVMSRAFRARPYTHWLALPGYSLNGRDPTHTGWHYLGILWTGVMSRAFRARPCTHWLALPGYSLNGRNEQGVQSETLHTLTGTTWVFSERAWWAGRSERDPTHTDSHYLGILWTGVMSRAWWASPYTHWLALPGYSLNGRDEQGVQSETLHTLTGTTWVFS